MANLEIKQQVENVLDRTRAGSVDVIVQMEAEKDRPLRFKRTAGEILKRRRLSLTPRDLLPEPYSEKKPSKKIKMQTASSLMLLGAAAFETPTLDTIQSLGLDQLSSLKSSDIVRKALDRMRESQSESVRRTAPMQFWTSRSMPLRLKRDELHRLPKEVP
jgi:hypothetical protein